MKLLGFLVGAGMLTLAASQADATVVVTLSQSGFASQSFTYANDANTGTVDYGTFRVNVAAFGSGSPSSPNLFTNTLSAVNSGVSSASLTVDVVQSGLVNFAGLLTSSFTANGSNLASVVESTFLNGSEISSQTFSPSNLGSTFSDVDAGNITGAYTDGSRFVINANAGGTANSTINLQSAVPEPANWAMMLLGFGLIGATLRQRRTAKVSFG